MTTREENIVAPEKSSHVLHRKEATMAVMVQHSKQNR